jgi:LPXTG-motif cell wall-anchored protein
LSNAAIFTSWEEVTSTGELKDSSDVIDRTTGRINASYEGFQEGQTYYLENSPVFTGLSSTETGEHIYTYKQNIYVSYYAWFSNTYGTSSVTTTLTITDARALVKAVAQANATIANPGSYSDNYISALQAAVDAVPVNLIRGVQYYTQAEVDAAAAALKAAIAALEPKATEPEDTDPTEPEETEPEETTKPSTGDNVQTGDEFNPIIWVVIMLVALAGVVVLFLLRKKMDK